MATEALTLIFPLDATITTRRSSERFRMVIEGVAMAEPSDHGDNDVHVAKIAGHINDLYGTGLEPAAISYHLRQLTSSGQRCVLTKTRTGFYRFRDPLMRAYVRMKLQVQLAPILAGR
jgi:hypothetical protein